MEKKYCFILLINVFLAGWIGAAQEVSEFKSQYDRLERTDALNLNYNFSGLYFKRLQFSMNSNSNQRTVQSGSIANMDNKIGLSMQFNYQFWRSKQGEVGMNFSNSQDSKKRDVAEIKNGSELSYGGRFGLKPVSWMNFSSDFGPLQGREFSVNLRGFNFNTNVNMRVDSAQVPFFKSGDDLSVSYQNQLKLKEVETSRKKFEDLKLNLGLDFKKAISDTTAMGLDIQGGVDNKHFFELKGTKADSLPQLNQSSKGDFSGNLSFKTKFPYDISVDTHASLGINALRYQNQSSKNLENEDTLAEAALTLARVAKLWANPLTFNISYSYKQNNYLKPFHNFIQKDKTLRIAYKLRKIDFSYAAGLYRKETPDDQNYADQDKFVSQLDGTYAWTLFRSLSGNSQVGIDLEQNSYWWAQRSANNNLTTLAKWKQDITYNPSAAWRVEESFGWSNKMIDYDFFEQKNIINTDFNFRLEIFWIPFVRVNLKHTFTYYYYTRGHLAGELPWQVLNELNRIEDHYTNSFQMNYEIFKNLQLGSTHTFSRVYRQKAGLPDGFLTESVDFNYFLSTYLHFKTKNWGETKLSLFYRNLKRPELNVTYQYSF